MPSSKHTTGGLHVDLTEEDCAVKLSALLKKAHIAHEKNPGRKPSLPPSLVTLQSAVKHRGGLYLVYYGETFIS